MFPFPKLSPSRTPLFARDVSNARRSYAAPLPLLGFLPPTFLTRARSAPRVFGDVGSIGCEIRGDHFLCYTFCGFPCFPHIGLKTIRRPATPTLDH